MNCSTSRLNKEHAASDATDNILREGREQSMKKAINVQRSKVDDLYFFLLEGLLPAGQALSVNTTNLIISLVSTNSVNGNNPILLQQSLTETDIRLLLLLLQSPYFCPQELLRAGLFCSYSGLLAGLFSSETAAGAEWQTTIEEQRLLLRRAQERGTWKKELKPLYNALSKLRSKLRPFGLQVANCASSSAYALLPLPQLQRQASSSCNSNLLFLRKA
jgi:hypothetical protein